MDRFLLYFILVLGVYSVFLVYRDQVYQYDPQLSSRQAEAQIGVVQALDVTSPVTSLRSFTVFGEGPYQGVRELDIYYVDCDTKPANGWASIDPSNNHV